MQILLEDNNAQKQEISQVDLEIDTDVNNQIENTTLNNRKGNIPQKPLKHLFVNFSSVLV